MISVVVCTFNRADVLRIALESLCQQTLDKTEYEVIVVDNNSTDETPQVVREFEYHGNVRYVLEKTQGLSPARNRGWQEANGEYVGYTDDDCRLPEQWLDVAHRIVTERTPHAFGGPHYPFYLTPKPDWFLDRYATSQIVEESCNLSKGEFLSGGNMFFRRSILEKTGGFNPEIGMKAGKRQYGDEIQLQIYMHENIADCAIYYDLDLFVYHLAKSLQMDVLQFIPYRFSLGRDTYYVFEGHRLLDRNPLVFTGRQGFLTMWLLGQILWDGVRAFLLRNRNVYPYWQNYIYENAVRRFTLLGIVYERYRLYWRHRRRKQVV